MNSPLDSPILRTTFSALCDVPAHTPYLAGRLNLRYVQTHWLHKWAGELATHGPVVLITHGSDMTADDAVAKLVPPNVEKWFTVNCATDKATALPIGLRIDHEGDRYLQVMRDARRGERRNLLYLCATYKNAPLAESIKAERGAIYRQFDRKWVTRKGGYSFDDVPFDEFCSDICSHEYVLCPRGACPDTHRMWEALYLGSIPVVKRCPEVLQFDYLPILFVDDYEDVTVKLLEANRDRLRNQLAECFEPLTANYWLEQIRDAMPIR